MENNNPKANKPSRDKIQKKSDDLNREDSARQRSGDTGYSQFMKDKRKRVVRVEKNERGYTPKEGSGDARPTQERRSFNPNFTKDNKRVEDGRGDSRGGYAGKRDDRRDDKGGYKGEEKRSFGEKKPYGTDSRKPYGADSKKPYGADSKKPYGADSKKPYGADSKKPYGADSKKPYGADSKKPYGADSKKPYGADSKKPYGADSKKPYGADSKKPYGADSKKPYTGDSRKPASSKGGYSRDARPSQSGGRDNYPKFSRPKLDSEIRLNRYLAMSGVSSRREADELITAGLVSVNGVIVTELGSKVSASDVVKFNDSIVKGESKIYIVMNKPKGYVTTIEDPHADKTVMDLLRNACTERIYPVGRLDKNSLGVLLFTNDGDLTKRLTHPSFNKKKIYQVTLDRPVTKADMESIASGVELEDGPISVDAIEYVGEGKRDVGLEIHSGRNRIVRRIFEHLGYKVQKLDRVYFAGLNKKDLKRGAWRFLTPREVDALHSGLYE